MGVARFAVLSLAMCLGVATVSAQQAPASAEETENLDVVLVSGEYPGPGLWKVTRADDSAGHVLWIVGDPPPLPKRMKWKSKDIEAVVLGAQEILRDSTVRLDTDERIGIFRGLTLLPAMLEARRNPEEAKLADVLPPVLYARWLVQKKIYLGWESGIENWRPLFAAEKLLKAAYKDLRLRESGVVWEVIDDLAKKHKIKVTTPAKHYTFKRAEVRTKLKEFSRESLADMECFDATLALTEALADRPTQNARAHAWAIGDHETLSQLPVLPNARLPCAMAVLSSQVALEVLPADLREQVHAAWLEAAEKSLANNVSTFAIVPFVKLTRAGGYLEMLAARGYHIEAPL